MKIFGPKRDGVTGEWRKLYGVEVHDLYFSPNTIWVTKPRRIEFAGHVECMMEGRIQGFGWDI